MISVQTLQIGFTRVTEPTITLHAGDNRDSLRRLIDQGVRVHSVVCDPPYGLVSTAKRFGKEGSAAAKSNGATGVFKRASGGFMGKQWDASGIERDPEFWRLIHDILLPGGYVLAFSSPRTGHWQACAMEMGGFIMHPFFGWVYGSGFPKAHNAARAVDKALGVESVVTDIPKPGHEDFVGRGSSSVQSLKGTMGGEGGFARPWMDDPEAVARYHFQTKAGSEEAAQWEGWAYGAQSMKPALEPVYFGQKPFSEKNGALNLLKHGVGAVNIDGCRVPANDGSNRARPPRTENAIYGGGKGCNIAASEHNEMGRHPANLIHDDSDEVRAMFPNDSARFFNGFPFEADPLFYHAKASKADRAGSKHPTVKPVALMQHFVRLVTPPGGVVLDPFGGSGTTAEAARREGFDCILMEADDQYVADIRERFGLPSDAAEDDFESMFNDTTQDNFDSLFG